jgi:hypothetical protein
VEDFGIRKALKDATNRMMMMIIMKFKNDDGVSYIHKTRDRDRWHSLVNTVMNILVP